MKITKRQLRKIVLEERRKLQENYVSPAVIHDAMRDIEKALLTLLEEGATREFLVDILQEIMDDVANDRMSRIMDVD